MRSAVVSGLPCGPVEVWPLARVRIGEAPAGEWAAVAWPAQFQAGEGLMALQASLWLACSLAEGGWPDATRERDERPGSDPLTGWAWATRCSGFQCAVEYGGRRVSAAERLAEGAGL